MAAEQVDLELTEVPVFPERIVTPYNEYVEQGHALYDFFHTIMQPEYNTLREQYNVLSVNVNANALEASLQAIQSENSAIDSAFHANIAKGAANYKGEWIANYETDGYQLGMSISFNKGIYYSKINDNLYTPVLEEETNQWFYLASKVIPPTLSTTNANMSQNDVEVVNIEDYQANYTYTTKDIDPTIATSAIVGNTVTITSLDVEQNEVATCQVNVTVPNVGISEWVDVDVTITYVPIVDDGTVTWNEDTDTEINDGMDI